MIDIFGSDAFSTTSLAGAVTKIPYRPTRLGPGGLNLFDEKPIATTSIAIEEVDGQLSMIQTSARGSAGDFIGDAKRKLRSFAATHLRRNAKVMADEVQGVRMFGSEDVMQTIEAKRDEKLAILRAMHEVTWEHHRVGALVGKVLDADGSTVLLDTFTAFEVTQQTHDFNLTTSTLDVREVCELVADKIDDELGASTYDGIHVFCGGTFYDTLIKHTYVKDVLKAAGGQVALKLLQDLRGEMFKIGPLTFERAKRWKVKNHVGTTINLIDPDLAYAFPLNPSPTENGPVFIGRFAPQPFLDTVNRLNPPLVVKAVKDPGDQFIDLIGISCPLYLNTRPRSVVKLTKS